MAKRPSKKNALQQNVEAVLAQPLSAPPAEIVLDVSPEIHDALVESAMEDAIARGIVEMTPVEEVILDQVLDAAASDEAQVQAPEAVQQDEASVSFGDLMKEVPGETITQTMNVMKSKISERRQMEIEKNSYNDNIHRTLKNVEQTMVRPIAAQVLVAASVSPGFIVEQSREGEHYNVYAMGKLNDLVDALAGLKLSNAINRAIVRSMFKLRAAGVTISREILECAASDKIRVKDKQIEGLLVRHTVGATTAPTQTSSTLRALETLGIVKVTGTKQNCVVTILDTPQTAALEQVAVAMAA